uniref:Uncharacterized protein n=1 Tax=Eutreptiella gymnastica TaxID=73025 RepID=A0A6T2BDX4_9EUGL
MLRLQDDGVQTEVRQQHASTAVNRQPPSVAHQSSVNCNPTLEDLWLLNWGTTPARTGCAGDRDRTCYAVGQRAPIAADLKIAHLMHLIRGFGPVRRPDAQCCPPAKNNKFDSEDSTTCGKKCFSFEPVMRRVYSPHPNPFSWEGRRFG